MKITQRNSPNRTIGRSGNTPDLIVLHTTGGSFTSAINTIMNAANQVSYHFVISRTGEVIQAVDIRNMAWANGTRNDSSNMCNSRSTLRVVRERRINANLYSISIGFGDMPAGNPSAAQITAAVELIRHIRSEVRRIFGRDIPVARSSIVGHHEITPVTRPNCPGRAFPFDEIIQRVGGQSAAPAPNPPAPSQSSNVHIVVAGDSMSRIAQRFGVTLAALTASNPQVTNVDRISVGQRINIPAAAFRPYTVRVTASLLNIRRGPGTNHAVVGTIRDRGTYTIVEESNGTGASRWGRLRSGAGWISLDFTVRN